VRILRDFKPIYPDRGLPKGTFKACPTGQAKKKTQPEWLGFACNT
jgi:hypothetical protein